MCPVAAFRAPATWPISLAVARVERRAQTWAGQSSPRPVSCHPAQRQGFQGFSCRRLAVPLPSPKAARECVQTSERFETVSACPPRGPGSWSSPRLLVLRRARGSCRRAQPRARGCVPIEPRPCTCRHGGRPFSPCAYAPRAPPATVLPCTQVRDGSTCPWCASTR